MSSISNVNSYLFNTLFGNNSNLMDAIGYINTSTEKFKGNVTGYKPIQKNTGASYYTSALSPSDTQSYMAALKDLGSKLKDATASLTASGGSLFSKMISTVSKEDTLSVRVNNQKDAAAWYATGATKNVSVQQLATTQKNTGATLGATAINTANKGSNAFTLEKGGKTYEFSVNVNATDSNRTVQQKTADAINKQNIGVTATVTYDAKTKQSTLSITSNETGEKNAFTLADKEGKGNLIASLGADQVTQQAADAAYTVDGEQKTADKNTVDIGDGLTATLKKVSADEVQVGVKKDIEGIGNAIRDVVDSFNALREATQKYGNDKGAQSLNQRLDSIASSYASSLAHIGISQDGDGYLQIDNDKLTKAFEDGLAERYLGNDSAGFTQRLSQVAKSVSDDPNRYVSYQSRNSAQGVDTVSFADYGSFMSSYRATQLSTIGLLFNSGV